MEIHKISLNNLLLNYICDRNKNNEKLNLRINNGLGVSIL